MTSLPAYVMNPFDGILRTGEREWAMGNGQRKTENGKRERGMGDGVASSIRQLDKVKEIGMLSPSSLVNLEEVERHMGQKEKVTGIVQGTLHMLILKTLALEPMHGYGIGVRLDQISKGVFQVNAGSLFPALRRLERDGLIAGEWRVTENNRRAKYYKLTNRGRARLRSETREWELQTTAIARILQASLGEL
jgi:PadR family transcriptional regulator PadR